MIYEKYTNDNGAIFIKRINDDRSEYHIPSDPANSDYQAYLLWLENPTWVEPTLTK